jgi:hypothetical protein
MLQKKIKITLLLMVGIVVAGCGSAIKVSADYDKTIDFKKYKTFSVYNLKQTGSVNPANADRIINALKKQMTEKGFVEDLQDPDLHVNAISILERKQAVAVNAPPTNFYGYGGVYRPYGFFMLGNGFIGNDNISINQYDFKQGTLMIDVVDAKVQKVVWQGVGNSEIDTKPVNANELINYAVGAIMVSFPPEPKK